MMNYDIHIENLGAIEKADITITPLTILAGENGTGKSFVTKFLYSILNVTILDIFSNELNLLYTDINKQITRITSSIGTKGFHIYKLGVMQALKENIEEVFSELKANTNYPIVNVESEVLESAEKSIETFNSVFLMY
ncbi:hypothetical protein ACTXMH_10370 [Psychrobacter celer]|uniref:hypothetical protein n=1 Tax=Psychrobacter celer TaxID=306572 RepID=UPI003FCFD8C6